jgi:hypothetical protein
MCDECELIWTNLAEIFSNPRTPADAAFPACPACKHEQAAWTTLSAEEIQEAGLGGYLGGKPA